MEFEGWWLWFIIPLLIWGFGGWSEKGRCSKRKRRSHPETRSKEITRLRQELAESHHQIDALKTRLEALETIVTDEEADLRWQFHKLQQG